jgi:glucosamine-6-phosphate deaminase
MGIGTIMKARKILLIASGAQKAGIIRELAIGDVRPQIPASILRFHPDTTIIIDKAAAANI